MKRMIFTLVAMLSMTLSFAENENTTSMNAAEAYNMTVNMNKLGQALDLTKDQQESVAEIHKTFCAEMLFAAQYGREERSRMVDNAISKDLAYMSYVLNREQYRKYLVLLNVTMLNRGLR